MPNTPAPATKTRGIGYEVLITTYNGADYIAEQLESILRQQPAPQRVFVSDDGSTDGTRAIVNQIAESTSIPVSIIEGPRKGVITNVLTALPQTSAEYVFLADQDDIWLDNKAALFSEQMSHHKRPHLIFSDAWVWHPGKEAMESFWKLDRLNPQNANNALKLAFHNTVQGASACVNRALINQVAAAGLPADIMMHDWWLALVASGTGHVDFVRHPTLLYRQHGNNQVGVMDKKRRRQRPFKERLEAAARVHRQAVAFAQLFGHHLKPAEQRFFARYRKAVRGNLIQRFVFILQHRPRHRDLSHTLKLWVSIAITKRILDA